MRHHTLRCTVYARAVGRCPCAVPELLWLSVAAPACSLLTGQAWQYTLGLLSLWVCLAGLSWLRCGCEKPITCPEEQSIGV